ncbi:hypothetical protein [Bradyrhizobium sp. RDM4]|uniref:hypothetical protein n=1 Tax=Bradyrhizobium sp. RDM4 TaxID=3378765 RepID=UPI0038FC2EB4
MLTVRLIGLDDYSVREDGHTVGRIRLSHERARRLDLERHRHSPSPPFGDAASFDEAKGRFKVAWEGFKAKHGPEQLAKAYAEMNWANRPGRYGR